MAGRFLESKHKRGPGGRFTNKIGALNSTSKTARNSIRKRAKAKLIGNGLAKNEKPAKLKVKLGKRLVTKLEKSSQARARDRRRGKRTRR